MFIKLIIFLWTDQLQPPILATHTQNSSEIANEILPKTFDQNLEKQKTQLTKDNPFHRDIVAFEPKEKQKQTERQESNVNSPAFLHGADVHSDDEDKVDRRNPRQVEI